jgi:hypothetical protein
MSHDEKACINCNDAGGDRASEAKCTCPWNWSRTDHAPTCALHPERVSETATPDQLEDKYIEVLRAVRDNTCFVMVSGTLLNLRDMGLIVACDQSDEHRCAWRVTWAGQYVLDMTVRGRPTARAPHPDCTRCNGTGHGFTGVICPCPPSERRMGREGRDDGSGVNRGVSGAGGGAAVQASRSGSRGRGEARERSPVERRPEDAGAASTGHREPAEVVAEPCGRFHVNAQEWDEHVDIRRGAAAFLRAFDDYAHIDGRTPSHEVMALMASRNRLEEKLDAWQRSEGIEAPEGRRESPKAPPHEATVKDIVKALRDDAYKGDVNRGRVCNEIATWIENYDWVRP